MRLSILVTISEVTTLCFICLAASIGNTSLFLIVYKNPNLRTITNMFILNLAAANILVSMLSMPATMVTIVNGCGVFGHTACVVLGYFTILSFIASVMSLGMIAINRYFYIVKWNTYTINFTKTKALLYVAGVWFVSMSLASPPLFGWAEYRFIPENPTVSFTGPRTCTPCILWLQFAFLVLSRLWLFLTILFWILPKTLE